MTEGDRWGPQSILSSTQIFPPLVYSGKTVRGAVKLRGTNADKNDAIIHL